MRESFARLPMDGTGATGAGLVVPSTTTKTTKTI